MQYLLVSRLLKISSGKLSLYYYEYECNMCVCRNNYAVFKEIRTETVSLEGDSKKAKLFITLEKHADFDENIKKFEEIRLENNKNDTADTKQWAQAKQEKGIFFTLSLALWPTEL